MSNYEQDPNVAIPDIANMYDVEDVADNVVWPIIGAYSGGIDQLHSERPTIMTPYCQSGIDGDALEVACNNIAADNYDGMTMVEGSVAVKRRMHHGEGFFLALSSLEHLLDEKVANKIDFSTAEVHSVVALVANSRGKVSRSQHKEISIFDSGKSYHIGTSDKKYGNEHLLRPEDVGRVEVQQVHANELKHIYDGMSSIKRLHIPKSVFKYLQSIDYLPNT